MMIVSIREIEQEDEHTAFENGREKVMSRWSQLLLIRKGTHASKFPHLRRIGEIPRNHD